MPFTPPRRTKKRVRSTLKKKIKLHKYQKKAVDFVLSREEQAAGLFMAPSLGKTLATLTILKKLLDEGKIDKILIVAKMRICYLVWPKEIKKWGFDFTHSVLQGTKKDKLFEDDSDIHLINYENIRWLKPKLRGKDRTKYGICVLDESSKIKNHAAKRSKMMHDLSPQFDWRLILTGSPTPKSLLDVFSQIKFLDFGKRLGRYVTRFRNEYFYPSGYMGYDWRPFDDTEKRIAEKLKDIIYRVSHAEAGIELPKENATIRRVELPPAARKAYDELEKDYIANIESGVITASTAAVAAGKLRQVANGGIYDEEKVAHHIHDEKTEELIEIVEELQGSPVLVAYWYGHDLTRLKKAFPKAPYIGAGVSANESIKIEQDWNDGKHEILFGQPASIAHGLNLQDGGCYTVVFYSMPDNLEDYEQFIQRVLRQGNKAEFVNVIHIVGDNTVDEDVFVGLYRKDKTQQTFLNCLEERLNVKVKNRSKSMNNYEVLMAHVKEPLGPAFIKRNYDKQFLRETNPELFTHNFVNGIKDRLSAWLPKQHVAFLKDMGVTKLKDDEKLGKLYDRSAMMVEEILGASRNGEDRYVLKDEKTIDEVIAIYRGEKVMVKESRISTENETGNTYEGEVVKDEKPKRKTRKAKEVDKSGEHFDRQVAEQKGKGKATGRKAAADKKTPPKKKANTKAATKKAPVKKPATKKVPAKKVAEKKEKLIKKPKNKVKVTSDEFPRAAFREECLRIIRRTKTKEVGYLVAAIMKRTGCTELKAFTAMEGLRDKGFISFK